ncbi:hypothetical protein EPUS_07377 [Endocarpon pusillum Z07020]|uniref:Uncharacterized protein n=1 Tax=Endocarpon pusillum (strain Z07020 / HMAS-L-300199) TaxID=1263415 RepID=U1GEX9_ENDPU|nr:uncharacterized protein EPUS_07377 [Endocarpon pusillum Z07020]ERF76177.1 hypothetical protein EPUS_07377 [Endocarpon pusillum Z07020]
MEFFSIINKEYIIHIVIERVELDPLEQLKEELSDEDSINIKKEKIKNIKKEKNTELVPRTESTAWRILKFKVPSAEPESSTTESHKRGHSSTDDSFDRSTIELDQALGLPSTPKEKKSKKKKVEKKKKKVEKKKKKKGKKKITEEIEEEEDEDKEEEEEEKEEKEEEEEEEEEDKSKNKHELFYSPPVLRIKK